MLGHRLSFLLILLPSAALAQNSSQQFDLQCIGKTFIGNMMDFTKAGNWSQANVIYKVDFIEGRWCVGKCEETFPLKGINDKFIIMDHEEEKDPYYDKDIFVNRETGDLIDRMRMGFPNSKDTTIIMTTANCTRKPFSGFPARKF